jgi:plasmid stabilization system protein ParE
MPAVGVVFHRLAAEEYRKARRWYARRSPMTAERFVQAVDRAIERVLADPEAWPAYDEVHRWIKAGRYPYLLFYRLLSDNRVTVLAVAHSRKRPGYWRRRTL